MKSLSTFVFLFSLVLLARMNDARKGPEEYWRSIMKDEPMPKAIQDVLSEDSTDKENNRDRFTRDFDTKPNLIIYHSHVMYNQKDHELASSKIN
ncbi:Organ specific protein [Cynara cardunculus var. scolymus]|uniref:Organ specific protein n=2 Tax=Cynara cardunculus var. scolymus TaxID=59895 RepID=A0A103Y3Q3_CYNCS|nr:Organ specific protein [Cynara cardunculus var. scolymus]